MKTELIPYDHINVDATVTYCISALWKAKEIQSLRLTGLKRNFFTFKRERAESFDYFSVWGCCRQTWYYLTRMNSPHEKFQIFDSKLFYLATVEARKSMSLLVLMGTTRRRRSNKFSHLFYRLKKFVLDVTNLAARIFGDNPADLSTYWSTMADMTLHGIL